MQKLVRVAVGVILDSYNNVFIAQRQKGQHLAGLWEFPGGKIEPAETCEQALLRELQEELGILVEASEPLVVVEFHYPDKRVELDVRIVTQFSGEAHGREGQVATWVPAAELQSFDFPDANRAIISALQDRL